MFRDSVFKNYKSTSQNTSDIIILKIELFNSSTFGSKKFNNKQKILCKQFLTWDFITSVGNSLVRYNKERNKQIKKIIPVELLNYVLFSVVLAFHCIFFSRQKFVSYISLSIIVSK